MPIFWMKKNDYQLVSWTPKTANVVTAVHAKCKWCCMVLITGNPAKKLYWMNLLIPITTHLGGYLVLLILILSTTMTQKFAIRQNLFSIIARLGLKSIQRRYIRYYLAQTSCHFDHQRYAKLHPNLRLS